jgi:mediator of RNA polymerase II transcription subunit 16
VTWSKIGAIASITPDGLELQIRFLRSQPDSGEWDLTEPTTCEIVRGTIEEPLVHLEWAETNNPELAVFDSVGRITLLILTNIINQPFIMKRGDEDAVDGTHAIVGCHWLQATVATGPGGDKATKPSYNTLFGPAEKTSSGGYHFNSSFLHAEGPSHPQPGRSALLTVTASGLLKVTWMQANNRPEETRLELESLSNSDELITHAAFASEKSK